MKNLVILIGRLGRDPELKTLTTGSSVCNFSIATSERFKDKTTGEKKEVSTWHNLVLWNDLAKISAQYLHKGDLIYVEGKITNRSWEKDGVTRYVTEIVVNNMTMLSTKRPEQQSAPVATGQYDDDGFGPTPPPKTTGAPPPGTTTTAPAAPPPTPKGGYTQQELDNSDLPF